MDNISFEYYDCNDIIEAFGKDKVEKRWNTLYTQLDEFLIQNNLSSAATVNKFLLTNVILDYYYDIKRLKDFHDIEKINSQKIIAYTAYWLLYRKPIQIINPQPEGQQFNTKELATLNERFTLQYILNYLSESNRGSHILDRALNSKGLENFSAMMLYYLEYRLRDAQSLEMIITSFFAGQIYERTDKDISSELHSYDH
jgi:hypothetical protein